MEKTVFKMMIEVGIIYSAFFAFAAGRSYHPFGRAVSYDAKAFRCPSEGFHPDPDDCMIFYHCISLDSNIFTRFSEPTLTAFQFSCGEGTVFDPSFNVCNYPGDTSRRECGGRGIMDQTGNRYELGGLSMLDAQVGNPYPGPGYPNYPQPYGIGIYHPEQYPNDSENQVFPGFYSSEDCGSEGFFPVPGDCNRFVRCTDNGMGGFTKFMFRCGEGTVWDQKNLICNYPSAVPGCGGTNGSSSEGGQGYPISPGSSNENAQYPDQGGSGPGQTGYPQQGNYPSQGNYPGQSQNQANEVNQSGYPQQGSDYGPYPTQGYPRPGNTPPTTGYYEQENQGGYPGQPTQTGYPQQGGYPGQQPGPGSGPGGYPQPGNQGNRPPPTGYPQQGNGPYPPGSSPQGTQGSYPQQSNTPPPSWNYPSQQVDRPNPTGNPPPIDYPDTYPNQGGYPGQNRPGYPSQSYPPQGSQGPGGGQGYPGQTPEEYGDGNPIDTGNSGECQSDGFFSVPGDCVKFFRCVDNGKGGYFKHDFMCGPGTVWDQEILTCNHPWAVQRTDCSVGMTTESNMDTSRSTPSWQQSTSNQNWSQSQTTSSFTQTSSSSSSSSSFGSSSTTSSSSQNQQSQSQSTTNQQSGSQSVTDQQTNMQSQNGMTTPMRPENRPTTEQPQQGTTPGSSGVDAPSGSKPSQPDKNSPVKCEKAGFYPMPGDCKKFYRCVDWDGDKGERFSVYYFQCGEGTIWDPALETCQHEESVYPPRDCGGKPGENNQTQPTTEKNTDNSETTEPTGTDETTEPSTSTKQTSTTDSTSSTLPSTDGGATTAGTETDATEMTTRSPMESTPATTDGPTDSNEMTPESTDPTESVTEEETNPTTDNSNEKPDQTSSECPAMEEGQVAFVCPTGFRRHPKDCNLFYQCTISKEGDVNVMTLSCKNDTVYDERKIQCLPPDETDPCPNKGGRRARFYRRVEPEALSSVPIATSESLCPGEGQFPYQGDCQRYFKCQKDRTGKMQGYLYQCPSKYSFSESSKRCQRSSTQSKCPRSLQYLTPLSLKWMTSKVPVEDVILDLR